MSQVELQLQLGAVLVGRENTLVLLHHFVWFPQKVLGIVGVVQGWQVDVLQKRLQAMASQVVPDKQLKWHI